MTDIQNSETLAVDLSSAVSKQGDDIKLIVDDVSRHFEKWSGCRRATAFYWLVQGGNVDVVAGCLDAMTSDKMSRIEDWILGKGKHGHGIVKKVHHGCKHVLRTVLAMMLLVLLIIAAFTPFLGLMILIASSAYTWGQSDEKSEHPLYIAACSGSLDMVKLFASHGVRISQTDNKGNNVFHLLVDLSVKDYQKASKAYQIVIDSFPDKNNVRREVYKHTNIDGLTPVECCIKYGSAKLFREITETEGIIRHNVVKISPHHFEINSQPLGTISSKNGEMDNDTKKEQEKEDEVLCLKQPEYSTFCLTHYDVTVWNEKGCMNRRSLPLILLKGRNAEKLSRGDAESILTSPLLRKWMAMHNITWTLNIPGMIFRALWVFLALGLAIVAVQDLNQLPLADKFGSLVDKETCDDSNYTSLVGKLKLNGCGERALVKLQTSCDSLNTTVNVKYYLEMLTHDHLSSIWSPSEKEYKYTALVGTLGFIALISISWAILRNLLFLLQSLRGRSLDQGLRFGLSTRTHGSVMDEVIVLCSSWLMVYYFILVTRLDDYSSDGKHFELTTDFVAHIRQMIYVFCAYELFVAAAGIYALRLIPGIGHFVIITLKMIKYLIKFVVVYGVVFLLVSFIFHFVLREEECPVLRFEEFTTYHGSMFETFRLLLGHTDEFHYGSNGAAMLVYVLYSCFCVVLLLNFIIAVMTTGTGHIMIDPWRTVIMEREYLQESLSTHVFFHTLLWPLGEAIHRRYLRKEGFVVEKTSKARKVFIEVETTEMMPHNFQTTTTL